MVSSRDVLSVLKPALDGLSAALAMLFGFLNMIFTPVERLFQMVLELADRGMMFQWAVDLSLAVGAIVFVYMTKSDEVGVGESPEFQLSEFSARSAIFMSSVGSVSYTHLTLPTIYSV